LRKLKSIGNIILPICVVIGLNEAVSFMRGSRDEWLDKNIVIHWIFMWISNANNL
jgi:hypothetical protein